MKKLYLGHFGGKYKEDWFLAWAKNKKNAESIVNKMFGKPIFIEELKNVSDGALCLNPVNISEDDQAYYFLELLPDDLKFENDEVIQRIIINEKNSPFFENNETDSDIEITENKDSDNEEVDFESEEDQYQKIIQRIDKIKI